VLVARAGLKSRLHILLVAAATLWFALLVVTPLLPAQIAAAMYVVGAFICHQRPERSFHVDSIQLPVCARCLGLYGGAALGVAMQLVLGSGLPVRPRALLLAAAAPTLGMVGLEMAGLWQTSNAVRAAAGIWLGAAVAVAVVPSRSRTGAEPVCQTLYTGKDARHDR
jgi:uncharacterized membrane protein